jgi:hypothetical protein
VTAHGSDAPGEPRSCWVRYVAASRRNLSRLSGNVPGASSIPHPSYRRTREGSREVRFPSDRHRARVRQCSRRRRRRGGVPTWRGLIEPPRPRLGGLYFDSTPHLHLDVSGSSGCVESATEDWAVPVEGGRERSARFMEENRRDPRPAVNPGSWGPARIRGQTPIRLESSTPTR